MPPIIRGAQLLVETSTFEPISGIVRWIAGNECGLAFNVALAEDLTDEGLSLFDLGKRVRPGRARIKLPARIRAPDLTRKVVIENVGSGGALLRTGLSLSPGRGIMLEIDKVLPIGGYVRWSDRGKCGIMFSKLLPIAAAEEITTRCAVHDSWLSEIREAHSLIR